MQSFAHLVLAEREAAIERMRLRAEEEQAALQREAAARAETEQQTALKYQPDPNLYAEEVLKVTWWHRQREIATAVANHPRVFVQASQNIGKTFFLGGLINWWVDCFNPSICKTTAPNKDQAVKLTWGEVRQQRHGRDMPPTGAKIQFRLPDGSIDSAHYAEGYTARDATSFQGTHSERLLIALEEACGIKEEFWEATDGMTSSGEGNKVVAVTNPTDPSSFAYSAFLSGEWHVISISALEHPNITAELNGEPRPFPKAIALSWVESKLRTWCRKLEPKEKPRPDTDFCWPPLEHCKRKGIEPTWYRPDARFESRVLGRWPSSNPDGLWSDALLKFALQKKWELQKNSVLEPVELGCDVARKGDNDTAIHVRQGGVSLHHEWANGWDTSRTAGRLKELCRLFAPLGRQEYFEVAVKIDDTGVGGGVVDQAEEFNFVGINAGSKPIDVEGYKYTRDELWFNTQERAEEGELDLSMLNEEAVTRIRRQALGVRWRQNARGQRVVEEKDKTKARIKISPDDMDAMNLAYYSVDQNTKPLLGGDREALLNNFKRRQRR